MSKPKTVVYALNKNKYLREPEVEALNRVLESHKDKDPRNCTLLWLLLHTGARATEALNLRPEDLNDHDQTVFITGIKNSKDREIPVPAWLYKRLQTLVEPGQLIFQISYPRLDQIWHQYRPVEKKLHGLRHTFAITLYKRSRDLRLVQTALGHKNINNTMVYADYVYSQEELRKMIVA